VFITAGPITKLFAWGGGGEGGGPVLRETTSRDLCGLVCPSRTSERGGEGYCVVKEGGGEEERERERAVKVRLRKLFACVGKGRWADTLTFPLTSLTSDFR
jgi:hypothetical protein